MRLLIELSGEQPAMALSEAMGACRSLSLDKATELVDQDAGMAVIDTNATPEDLASRLALCWNISEYLFSFMDADIDELFGAMDLDGRSFAIRVKRTHDIWIPEDSQHLIDRVGQVLGKTGHVDLKNPDVTLRIIMGKRLHVGLLRHEIDRKSFEARKPKDRPFSHPISLHPRYARVLVNLAHVHAGDRLLDPFCGTGGILIEGGLVGAEIMGSDIDARMIEGCEMNLKHFLGKGGEFQLLKLDVADIEKFGKVDAIVTDPPYGRSASTAKEDVEELYIRAFESFVKVLKPSGRLAIVFPDMEFVKLAEEYLNLLEVHDLFVHGSLTRHFCVFEKK